jgi:DNA polymerase I-like protein with 3'-5' exonuclease and polymerase domains
MPGRRWPAGNKSSEIGRATSRRLGIRRRSWAAGATSPGAKGRSSYNDRLNGPIQAGGADQLYLALSKLLDDPLPDVHVIITTHDEVILEAPTAAAQKALEWLLSHMMEAIRETIGEDLATEDCVEGEIGSGWGKG